MSKEDFRAGIKKTEAELAEMIHSLADAVYSENEEQAKETLGQHLEVFMEKYPDWIKDPEDFDCMILNKFEDTIEFIVKVAHPEVANDRNKLNKLSFVYMNYDFIKLNLEFFIRKKEGWVCECDKTRWLIKCYIDYIIDDSKIPDMTIDDKCYWKPAFGTGEKWIQFCESLYNLFHGNPIDFYALTQYFLTEIS